MSHAAIRPSIAWLLALKRAGLLAALWLVLSGAEPGGLAIGAVAVAGATWMSLRLLPPQRPLRLVRIIVILPRFLWQSLLGGLDVAWRAFHPRLPLRPGWVLVPSTLSDGGKVALGAEFSLMPGTLVAGSRGEALLFHALDTGRFDERAVRLDEARMARVLGGSGGNGARTAPETGKGRT